MRHCIGSLEQNQGPRGRFSIHRIIKLTNAVLNYYRLVLDRPLMLLSLGPSVKSTQVSAPAGLRIFFSVKAILA
jgi:hypothetical protein